MNVAKVHEALRFVDSPRWSLAEGAHIQALSDAARVAISKTELLTECDSYLSLWRYRYWRDAPDDLKQEVDALIEKLRLKVAYDSQGDTE